MNHSAAPMGGIFASLRQATGIKNSEDRIQETELSTTSTVFVLASFFLILTPGSWILKVMTQPEALSVTERNKLLGIKPKEILKNS